MFVCLGVLFYFVSYGASVYTHSHESQVVLLQWSRCAIDSRVAAENMGGGCCLCNCYGSNHRGMHIREIMCSFCFVCHSRTLLCHVM